MDHENHGMLPLDPNDLFHYYRLRESLPRNSPLHAIYGPLEHGQFTEEMVRSNPAMAVPLAVAAPAYTLGKATGLIQNTRSPASWAEVIEAYKGMLRGLQR